jgi:gluconolactonase
MNTLKRGHQTALFGVHALACSPHAAQGIFLACHLAGHAVILAAIMNCFPELPFLPIICLTAALSAQSLAADSKIIAPGATLQKLSGGFSFTEGPACDAQGNVFFTDQPTNRILKWSIDGKLSTFMEPCGRANGLSFDHKGNLWACADEKNELWRISPAGEVAVVVKDYQGKLLNGPNDVWIRPSGGLYFTDPYYKRPYWNRGPKEMDECVYYLPASEKDLVRVIDDLKQPNGIIGTPDGKLLYVADIGAGKTYRYAIQPDGSLTEKKLFCELGSDGMTIDSDGNIYLTGKGVTVFDPSGKKIEHIDVQEAWSANVCFGGKDRQTLFITASKGLYGLRMNVKGVDSQ